MSRPKKTPVVGVTVDRIEVDAPTEATYAVRCNYIDALVRAGAHAVLLPFEPDAVLDYATFCDGFLITGSQPGNVGSADRQEFDSRIIRTALYSAIPILGVCNGMQMIGLACGGHLINDIARQFASPLDHNPAPVPDKAAHDLSIRPVGILGRIANERGLDAVSVNSQHTQTLGSEGDFEATAQASDGVIEAIELASHPFALGVQWHPEYGLSGFDNAIFEAFVAACRRNRKLSS